MYYRVAIQNFQTSIWQWKSTPLSSLHTLFQWLQWYRSFPHDRLRIFSSPSREAMNEQLARENKGLGSTSVTATHFLHQRRLRLPEVSRATSAPGAQRHEETTSIAISAGIRLNESSRATSLDEKFKCPQEKRRLELELGAGADHDVPYHFSLPASMPQVLAWIRLLARVQREEVQP
jgi:hypothetical protein